MDTKSLLCIIGILWINWIYAGSAERTKDQMYDYFNGKTSCFRRMNATHQTGCSSKRDGSTGILHYIENEDDLKFLFKSGTAGNYMPVMPTSMLTINNLKDIENSGKITGLILYNLNRPEPYSHEVTCPNPRTNLEKTCSVQWNPYGTGILQQDIPFPVYYVENEEDLGKIKDCFTKFNNFSYDMQYARSLCSVELDAFMYATTDTPTCIRRSNCKTNLNPIKFCDPLGGENIWASLFPFKNSIKDEKGTNVEKFVIVAARLDTTSLLNGIFPGAASSVSGIITLLATADLLKRMVNSSDKNIIPKKNVLFVLFNGESYDYIGSQRMIYDMENNEFPMKHDPNIKNPLPNFKLENISLFIELSQLTRSNGLHIFRTTDHSENEDFITKLKSAAKYLKLFPETLPLPPASLHTFLKASSHISGLVLADHGREYANKYYHSIYDNATNLDYQYYNTTDNLSSVIPLDSIQYYTANVSEMLATSLFWEVMDKKYNETQKPRLELIDELYNCYLLDADCKVHQAVQQKKLRETAYNSYSFYVGVTVSPNLLTYVIGLALGWLTGDIVPLSNKTCTSDPHTPMYQYFNMSQSLENLNETVCFRTMMNFSEAVSPAFVIKDYDWKSGKYSSWTESTWKDFSVRMFLKPSAAHEHFTIALGSVTFVMSLILVYFIKSRSHILFATAENCSPTSC